MVHELLGLNDNRVALKGAPGVRKDLEEVSFSPRKEALPEYHETPKAKVREMVLAYCPRAKLRVSIRTLA